MRGSPLVMLGLLLGAWVTGRAVLWESPFPLEGLDGGLSELLLAQDEERVDRQQQSRGQMADGAERVGQASSAIMPRTFPLAAPDLPSIPRSSQPGILAPRIAAGHQFLMAAAFRVDWQQPATRNADSDRKRQSSQGVPVMPAAPPFDPPQRDLDRWSLDAFAFYRAGSDSTSISQGRVPVYGASQAAAVLQYRARPGSRHDPRAYLRGYHAFVPDGENEAALGVSARPVPAVPVRVFAEVRVTENTFGTDIRPATYAVTEFPVVDLPGQFALEAYGGAGYVGGSADTPFADGQIALTREVASFDGVGSQPVRLSVGGAGWGGAQKDANRVDVGPTMRLDLTVGTVPARVSLDWRERVAGDAAPTSGLAATLSTRF